MFKQVAKKMISDRMFLTYKFYNVFGRRINWSNPKTYNEKLQWLKVHDHNPYYTKLVDKYEVKKIVSDIIGSKYVIPTLGVWDRFEDINFQLLPNRFVLKCTHDSGSYIICSDKETFDIQQAEKKIKKALKKNFYWTSREWPYKNVKPRIIAEKYIGNYPRDYKFFAFNGIIDSVMLCDERDKGYPVFRFYSTKWERLFYQHEQIEPMLNLKRPDNFDEMLHLARKLAQGFSHVRLDFYNVEGKIYFGEFTFYNQGGFDTDITYDTDLMWGTKINLKTVLRRD